MAKLTTMPSISIIKGFRGTLDFYYWMGIPVVRSWPRSPGHDRSPAVEARWPAFATATKLWNQTSPQVQDAYNRMAAGLHLTGRDIQVKLYLKALYLELE